MVDGGDVPGPEDTAADQPHVGGRSALEQLQRRDGHVQHFGRETFYYRAFAWISRPTGPDVPATLAIGWGGAFAYFLYMIKLRVSWWPLHPLGFAVSTSYSIGTLWLPMMIAWAAKLVTFKAGGLTAYRTMLNFFLGLVLGDFIMGCLWPIVGWALKTSTYSFMQ